MRDTIWVCVCDLIGGCLHCVFFLISLMLSLHTIVSVPFFPLVLIIHMLVRLAFNYSLIAHPNVCITVFICIVSVLLSSSLGDSVISPISSILSTAISFCWGICCVWVNYPVTGCFFPTVVLCTSFYVSCLSVIPSLSKCKTFVEFSFQTDLLCPLLVSFSCLLDSWSLRYCSDVISVTFTCLLFLIISHPICVTFIGLCKARRLYWWAQLNVREFIFVRFTWVKLMINPPCLKLPELRVNSSLFNAINENPFKTVK